MCSAAATKPRISLFFFFFSLQNVRIDPNSISFSMWRDIPVPFYMSVYFFEVLNPEQVLHGAKPMLNQRGPYVYRLDTTCGLARLEPGHHRPNRLLAGSFGISILGVSPMTQDFKEIQKCSHGSLLAKATNRTSGCWGGKADLCCTEL